MLALGPGRVTILDIARDAGVSKSTVSLVLRESPVVGAETRSRVQAAMGRLGYVYHRGAASLRHGVADTVGMVINDLTNPFFAELAVGIERGLAAAGMIPFLANTGESPARQGQVMKMMREHGAAGFIVCPALGTDSGFMHEVEGWRLPLVSVMRRLPGARASYVGPDNQQGAERATSYLIELGHRRIAFLGGRQGMVVQEERAGGYAAALEAASVPLDPALVVEAVPNREGGRAALQQALMLADPPTAALCFNDVVAFGVLHGLAARGLRAGSDFAVIGFDDVQDARHMALSTVAVDSAALGERAAHILLHLVRQPQSEPVEHHGEVALVVRASCGQGRRAWQSQSAGA